LNLSTRLVQCVNRPQTLERFAAAIARMRALCPQAEAAVRSSSVVGFCFMDWNLPAPHWSRTGTSASPSTLCLAPRRRVRVDSDTEPLLLKLVERLMLKRVGRDHRDPFYRLQPERWLQSIVERDIALLDSRLDPALLYPQVPAFCRRRPRRHGPAGHHPRWPPRGD